MSEAVRRSLVTLKALAHWETGGIIAAATTSLPEKIGGTRNWDYRFCWLRDATFTLYALLGLGFVDEAEAWRAWLVRAVAGSPDDLQIMYGVGGERHLEEYEVPWLPGYENSAPVRIGKRRRGPGAAGHLRRGARRAVRGAQGRPRVRRDELVAGVRDGGASRDDLGPARRRHLGKCAAAVVTSCTRR